ncbi:MAG: pyrroline-5-carboxylate reductase [Pseudomonadales bacterium]
MKDTRISFLGGGNIAQAIVGGLLENGVPSQSITVADPAPEQLQRLASINVNTTTDNLEAAANSELLVVCVKPDVVGKLVKEIAATVKNKLIISVAAGITTEFIAGNLEPHAAIVRCMPNTPALVQCGMTGLFANEHVSPSEKELAEYVASAIGAYIWFDDESDLDAVTAISGSGPAYFFYVMEAMEEAGRKLDLPADVVHKLVTQTALGAAKMAIASDDSPGELRRKVTSAGGTTQAALDELQEQDLVTTFEMAIKAAWQRSKSLSGT